MKEEYEKARDEVKRFLADLNNNGAQKQEAAKARLELLSLDLHDKYKQAECKELIKSGFIDKVALGKFLKTIPLNSEHMYGGKEGQIKLRQDIVKEQKDLGKEIRENKSKGGGTMLSDFLTRIKNIHHFGYISEGKKSNRTKSIEKQKEIGKVIRGSDSSVIPNFIRSTLGMTKKNGGRGL